MIYKSLEDLVKDDSIWRKMSLKICRDEIIADELLHIFYDKYISAKPKEVTGAYVYASLCNHYKELNKTYKFKELLIDVECDEYDIELDKNFEYQILMVKDELKKIHFFHRMIFEYIVDDGMSIRELSKKTGIGFNVIQRSFKETREYLKNKINE